MTSHFIWMRTAVAGIALFFAAPVAAQDLRDIPQQKTDTTITGPVAQPKVQAKQGGQVQGPPAPLETQLRDTPPDDIIAPQQPQLRPQTQSQPAPVQVQSAQPRASGTAPQRQLRVPAPTERAPQQVTPATRAPATTAAPPPVAAAPDGEGAGVPAPNAAPSATPDPSVTAAPSYLPNVDTSASNLAPADAAPAKDGPLWPWALGGLALVGLGYAFMMRRRPAAAGGGLNLGQTPWRDELDKDAPLPDRTVAKPVGRRLPDVKIPQAPAPVAAAPVAAPPPPPPPEPVKATANESGLIVSKVRRPVETSPGGSVMAEPMQAPPAPPPPPQPAQPRVANDGRIVSGRKASELGGPPPTPRRKRPRKELPGDSGMSFGYKVQR